MRNIDFRNNPFLLIIIISLVLIIMSIPIKENLAYSELISSQLEIFILSLALICMLALIINKLRIPHAYFSFINPGVHIYYLPAIISVFLFTNGLNDLFHMSGSTLFSGITLLYGIATLSRAIFEEILFRGVVFGIVLSKYYDSKNGILKSIVISGVLFGLVHILNIWTRPERGADYATMQMCNAACLGVLYCAIYLKTRSIIVLGFIHFINNFAAHVDVLGGGKHVIESVEGNSTIAEAVASEILGIIILSLPLLMGLYIVKRINREDVEKFMGRRCVPSARSGRIGAEN